MGTTSVEMVREKGYDLTGQTHVITGGDSGIGLGIATALMEAKARVVFLAHNVSKTMSIVRSIGHRTGNSNFRIVSADLTSMNSTKHAADALMDEKRINAFIGDAGAVLFPSFLTSDGFESEFQLEYLSHFYLVESLLPKLRQSRGRIVFTGSDGTSPYDKWAGLCPQLRESSGCESLDRIAARVNRPIPAQSISGINGNEFLGMYLREMIAKYYALSETDVTAHSFHPGWTETPGTSGTFDKAAEQFFGAFILGKAGVMVGVLGYLIGMLSAKKALLVVLLGCLVGYTFAGDWVVVKYCGSVPYYQCLCNDPNGTLAAKTCPTNSLVGSMGGAYLAAAHASEVASANGALTVLCGTQPTDLVFDPYRGMVKKIGEEATNDYLKAIYNQSKQWLVEAEHASSLSNFRNIESSIRSSAQIVV